MDWISEVVTRGTVSRPAPLPITHHRVSSCSGLVDSTCIRSTLLNRSGSSNSVVGHWTQQTRQGTRTGVLQRGVAVSCPDLGLWPVEISGSLLRAGVISAGGNRSVATRPEQRKIYVSLSSRLKVFLLVVLRLGFLISQRLDFSIIPDPSGERTAGTGGTFTGRTDEARTALDAVADRPPGTRTKKGIDGIRDNAWPQPGDKDVFVFGWAWVRRDHIVRVFVWVEEQERIVSPAN